MSLSFDHFLSVKRANEVVSDSGFCYWLVNSVLNLPDVQVMFFEEFE